MSSLIRELEHIRGEAFRARVPISEIPCIETSDNEKLCKNPLVSVSMTTYNHESYIRQAIEGVMMQKTDFEFELVIGEDASTDKTREICFEYQKKYPDKIRVLWSEKNVYSIGGNGTRVDAACRGEYIAYCEGDDFWTNPDKLQLQVDAFRANPKLGICLMGTNILIDATGETKPFDPAKSYSGLIKAGSKASNFVLFKRRIGGYKLRRYNYQTSGWMVSKAALQEVKAELADIFAVRLSFGDTSMLSSLAEWYDMLFMPIAGSTYRVNSGSVSFAFRETLERDLTMYRIYWLVKVRGWPLWLAKLRYLPKVLKGRSKK